MIRKITNATYNSTTDWSDEVESTTFLKKGHIHLELTNPYVYDESDILAGSTVDVRGVVYTFTTNQTPTGTETTGLNYIRMDASTLEYTTVAPIWNSFNNGWYDSTGLKRYIISFYYDAGIYTKKTFITDESSIDFQLSKIDVIKKQTFNTAMSFLNKSEIQFVSSDLAAGDEFGCSVDVDGDYIISGANGDASYAGAAYVFHKEEEWRWDAGIKIVGSDTVASDYFGTSVSISGDYCIVGANGDATSRGAAYVFHRTDVNTWDSGTKLVASDGSSNDFFGSTVAINGDYCIVGAPNKNSGEGAAYVFLRTDVNTWDSGTLIEASDLSAGDNFGKGVDLKGDYCVVGSRYAEHSSIVGAGAAYVFLRTDVNTWANETKLVASDASSNDRFGRSVAIDGDWIIVGAYYTDCGLMTNAGSVYFFKKTGSNVWDTGTKVESAIPKVNGFVGMGVAICGDWATATDYSYNGDMGQVLVYHLEDDVWKMTMTRATNKSANSIYAVSVGVADNQLVVGASGQDTGGTNAGMTYLYKLLEKD